MIRVTVPRPVAEALMPRECVRSDCLNGHQVVPDQYGGPESVGPCPDCRGRGELPPVLRLLVVPATECWYHANEGTLDDEDHPCICGTPPAAIVRAIEAGGRVGIDVECETCRGSGSKMRLNTNTGMPVWGVCPNCTNGRVQVGSVLPTKVLPIYGPDTCPGPPSSGAPKHICIGPFLTDGEEPYPGMMAMHVTHLHDIAPDLTEALSVYGPAESLVGKFAVEVEDARREL